MENKLSVKVLCTSDNYIKWVMGIKVMLFQIGAIKDISEVSNVEVFTQMFRISAAMNVKGVSFDDYMEWVLVQSPEVQGVYFSLN